MKSIQKTETIALSADHVHSSLPVCAPLKPCGGDPYFGLSRSYWYGLERQGRIKLLRLRQRGSRKPRVLLPYEEALKAVKQLSVTLAAAAPAAVTDGIHCPEPPEECGGAVS